MARKKSPPRAKPAKKKRVAKKTGKKTKAVKRVAAKAVRRPAKSKTRKVAARKAAPAKRSAKKRDVLGEGNYTAARNFRKEETAFVQRNKARIPALGEAAEKALEGPQGDELRAAEAEARNRAL